jgi:hypothetical protein
VWSSLHPRGCFQHHQRRQDAAPGLPRKRGGVSAFVPPVAVWDESSPHPRGYFHLHRGRPAQRREFPATRGGVSCGDHVKGVSKPNSLHTQGCFLRRQPDLLPRRVILAKAGVFPSRAPSSRATRCLPRMRGGVSTLGTIAAYYGLHSPRGGGVSLPALGVCRTAGVFPGRGGVSYSAKLIPKPAPSSPRGGVSKRLQYRWTRSQHSPRARGCFQRNASAAAYSRVFPARAGVFPRQPRTLLPSHNLPRTRGGVSIEIRRGSENSLSSPHARGGSLTALYSHGKLSSSPRPRGVSSEDKGAGHEFAFPRTRF